MLGYFLRYNIIYVDINRYFSENDTFLGHGFFVGGVFPTTQPDRGKTCVRSMFEEYRLRVTWTGQG